MRKVNITMYIKEKLRSKHKLPSGFYL